MRTATVALQAFIFACLTQGVIAAPPNGNNGLGSVSIEATEPQSTGVFRPGQHISMVVTAEYSTSVSNATLELLVEDASNAVLARKEEAAPIGSWQHALRVNFVAPGTSAVNLIVLLHAKGVGFIGTDTRTIRVVQ